MKQRLILLDTSVACLTFRTRTDRPDEILARDALRALRKRGEDFSLFVPTLAIAEIVAPMSADMAAEVCNQIESMYTVVDFDRDAARSLAGWHGPIKAANRARPRGEQVNSKALKVDLMILACAIRFKMDGPCTLDGHFHEVKERFGLPIQVGGPSCSRVRLKRRCSRADP